MTVKVRIAILALCMASACLQAQEIQKRRLGPTINTAYAEVLPIASADGQMLFFTRAGYPDPTKREVIRQQYDSALSNCRALAPAITQLAEKEGETISAEQMEMLERLSGDDCDEIEADRDQALHNFEFSEHPNQAWFSRRQPDGTWGEAIRAAPPLNDDAPSNVGNMSIVSAAPDRNTLLIQGDMLFGRQRTDGCVDFAATIGFGDRHCLPLAIARRDERSHWTRSDRLRTQPFDPPLAVHGAALSPTGDAVILAARKPGAHVDNVSRLYVTNWLAGEALWSAPKALEQLNGEWDNVAPFMAPDGRTLYFASDRPGGLGGMDIWLTRRQGPGWLDWSEPENMGPAVNSEEDESSFTVDASGGFAFMSAGKGAQQDIYEFGLPPNLSPAPTAIVGGKIFQLGTMEVTDESGDGPLFKGEMPKGLFTGSGGAAEGIDAQAEAVVFVSMSNGGVAGSARFNPVNGEYSTALPVGDKYAAYVNVEGFAGIGQVVDLSAASSGQQIQQDLDITELAEGVTIRLNNVYFDTNQWNLLEESHTELQRLVGILEQYPQMRIEIAGHTDSVDSDEHNLVLSDNRSSAVLDYLVAAGINASRLQSRGYGERRPIASNEDEDGRQLNRRVEFRILAM